MVALAVQTFIQAPAEEYDAKPSDRGLDILWYLSKKFPSIDRSTLQGKKGWLVMGNNETDANGRCFQDNIARIYLGPTM